MATTLNIEVMCNNFNIRVILCTMFWKDGIYYNNYLHYYYWYFNTTIKTHCISINFLIVNLQIQ